MFYGDISEKLKSEKVSLENSKQAFDKPVNMMQLYKNRIFEDDIRKVCDKSFALEPETLPNRLYFEISIIYVLSGRGSALGEPVDNPDVADPGDDRERMRQGVKIANAIFRATGVYVPIYYNGRELHNKHLLKALSLPVEKGGFNYPKKYFIIQKAPTANTIDQAQGFKNYLEKTRHSVVAIVSSAYHLPRVARTFGKDSPSIKNPNPDNVSTIEAVDFILFGIDRGLKRNAAEEDARKEVDAMMNYSAGTPNKKPSIARYQPNNTFLNVTDVMFKWSFSLYKTTLGNNYASSCNAKVKRKKTIKCI